MSTSAKILKATQTNQHKGEGRQRYIQMLDGVIERDGCKLKRRGIKNHVLLSGRESNVENKHRKEGTWSRYWTLILTTLARLWAGVGRSRLRISCIVKRSDVLEFSGFVSRYHTIDHNNLSTLSRVIFEAFE